MCDEKILDPFWRGIFEKVCVMIRDFHDSREIRSEAKPPRCGLPKHAGASPRGRAGPGFFCGLPKHGRGTAPAGGGFLLRVFLWGGQSKIVKLMM